MSPGRHRAERAQRAEQPGRVPGLVAAIALAGAAWVFLVRAAVDFGRTARGTGDDATAWLLTGTATLGATLCLLLVLVLGARVLTPSMRGPSPPGPSTPVADRPRRSADRRRAS